MTRAETLVLEGNTEWVISVDKGTIGWGHYCALSIRRCFIGPQNNQDDSVLWWTVITGHNVNLLVLMTTSIQPNVYVPKPGKKKKVEKYFLLSVVAIVTRWKRGENILFLHMASKCDIISRLFKKCKIKCVNLWGKHQYLRTSMLHELSFGQKIDLLISGNRIKLQP